MATIPGFRTEMRTILGDLDGSAYTDTQLDTWRDEEIGTLWSLGLFKRGTNRGSEPTIRTDHNDLITRYYALPTSFRRVNEVEFIDAGHVAPPVLTAIAVASGGSLATGLFIYRISLTDSSGESFPGPARAVYFSSGATNSVVLTWPAITVGATAYVVTTGYKIYVGATPLLLTTVSSNATTTYTHTTGTGSGAAPSTDATTAIRDDVLDRSTGFDDLEDGGVNVRVEEAGGFENFKVRMFGEKEYTGVDDTSMKQEVLDVVLYGASIRAMTAELVRRAQATRSLVSTANTDTSTGSLSLALATLSNLYKRKISKALSVQARSTLMR